VDVSEIRSLLWGETDPFAEKAAFAGRSDFQGWASDNPNLTRAIDQVRPRLVVEVGVWKGGSVLTMAERMKHHGIDGAIIAIDTWLGSCTMWTQRDLFRDLRVEAKFPTVFRTFAANIVERGFESMVIPLPLDSINASMVLRSHNLRPDVIHLDGGHDYASVTSDLEMWWPMLNVGGVFIGDDYFEDGFMWPEVRLAFHDFFEVTHIENYGGKCYINKSTSDERGSPL
jgi:hypothetical protein